MSFENWYIMPPRYAESIERVQHQYVRYTFPNVRTFFGNAQTFGQTTFRDNVSTKVLYVTKWL